MAVRFQTNQDYRRTASLPNSDSVSMCMFGVMTTDTNALAALMGFENTGGSAWVGLETLSDGTSLRYANSGLDLALATITVGTPFFCGFTKNGATVRAFFRNLDTVAMTIANSASASTGMVESFMFVGASPNFGEPFNGRLSGVKVWDAVLTDAEMANESCSLRPARTANLHLWTPMVHAAEADCRIDFSGNARSWTATNTPTQEQGAPAAWGGELHYIDKPVAAVVLTGTLGQFDPSMRLAGWF